MSEEIKDTKVDKEVVVVEEKETKEEEQEEVKVEEPKDEKDPVEKTEEKENPVNKEKTDEGESGKDFDLQETLKNPEVQDFVAKIRKQEKDKLYGEITKRDDKVKGLEKEISELNETLDAMKDTTDSSQVEMQKTVNGLKKTVEDLKNDVKRKELDLYKEKALKEAGEDLILDLVGGDTEEEIKESIEKAKKKYKEIEERVATKNSKPVPKATNPKQESVKQLTQEEIAKMSPQEWAEHRANVKKQLGLLK